MFQDKWKARTLVLGVMILVFTLAFYIFNSTYSEKSLCNLSDAPTFRGIKLGMSKGDVLKVYPTARFEIAKDSPPFGSGIEYGSIVIPNFITPNSERYSGTTFEGVFDIKYKMLDARIYEIHVEYQKSLNFDSLEQFSEAISPKLGLADKWWLTQSASKSKNASKAMRSFDDRAFGLECGNYSFVTGFHPQYFDTRYYVKAIDETLIKKVEAKQQELSGFEERKREVETQQKLNDFKP